MGKRPLANAAQIKDLSIRETELAQRRDKLLVATCMDLHPDCTQGLVRKLESCGYDLKAILEKAKTIDNTNPNEDGISGYERSQRRRLVKLKENSHAAAKLQMAAPGMENWIPEKYKKIEDMSRDLILSMLLVPLHPAVLSVANLNALKRKDPHAGTKLFVVELLEFETGTNAGTKLEGPLRHWPYLKMLLAYRSNIRGGRCAKRAMSANFEDERGIYSLCKTTSAILMCHNFTQETAQLSVEELPSYNGFEDLYIANNMSEGRAQIRSRAHESHQGLACAAKLGNQIVNRGLIEPRPPREALIGPSNLAITNGTPAIGNGAPAITDDTDESRSCASLSTSASSASLGGDTLVLAGSGGMQEKGKDKPSELEKAVDQAVDEEKKQFCDADVVPPAPEADAS